MKVHVVHPSSMEATTETATEGAAAVCKPIRWHAGQRLLSTYVLVSTNDQGEVLDRAVLTVNQKTGKLGLRKMSGAGIPLDADASGTTKPAKKSADDIAEGQK